MPAASLSASVSCSPREEECTPREEEEEEAEVAAAEVAAAAAAETEAEAEPEASAEHNWLCSWLCSFCFVGVTQDAKLWGMHREEAQIGQASRHTHSTSVAGRKPPLVANKAVYTAAP
jgi:hypothetical protein